MRRGQADPILLLGTILSIAIVLVLGYMKIVSPLLAQHPQVLATDLGLTVLGMYAAPESVDIQVSGNIKGVAPAVEFESASDFKRVAFTKGDGNFYTSEVYADKKAGISYNGAKFTVIGNNVDYFTTKSGDFKLKLQKVWNSVDKKYAVVFGEE